ncbi:MAG: ABC transporter permease [Oscillibacter sp.]|nr:ABC transporter permease [Oscillibacter sp.]
MNRSGNLSKAAKAAGRSVFKRVLLILLALAVSSVFLAASGYDALAIFKGLYQSFTKDIAGTIRWSTAMVLAGLAVCVCYKADIANLGVDGQLFLGAAAASMVALHVQEGANRALSLVEIFLCAALAGMLFALIPALLKIYLNVNEVVSTLLLNFIGEYFVNYLVNGPMRDPSATTNLSASARFSESAWLPHLAVFEPSSANVGVYIALVLLGAVTFVFYRTTLGHEIKMVGANGEFARYAGINPKRTVIKCMCISGAIAGVIGAIEVTAVQHRLIAGFNPELGFKGIVVSLLAGNHPIGVLFSGIFFGALKNGGTNMERMTGVPSAISSIVEGIIILVICADFTFRFVRKKRKAEREGT